MKKYPMDYLYLNNKIMVNNSSISLYVSNNGGKDFLESKVNYTNENAKFITIEKML